MLPRDTLKVTFCPPSSCVSHVYQSLQCLSIPPLPVESCATIPRTRTPCLNLYPLSSPSGAIRDLCDGLFLCLEHCIYSVSNVNQDHVVVAAEKREE